MKLYTGPLRWIDRPDEPSRWEGPSTASLLDTRPLEKQATAGGSESRVLFVSGDGISDSDYELIAEGDFSQVKTDAAMIAKLPAPKARRPQGDTVERALVSLFTECADPDGVDGPKPIVPDNACRLRLNCGGVILSERFQFGKHRHSNMLQAMVQRQVADAVKQADKNELPFPMLKKVLGYELRKYRVPNDQWRQFVPANLRARVGEPRDPETSISDDFNRADGGLGASWANATGTWSISSNAVRKTASLTTSQTNVYQTALSGSDHYAQIYVINSAGNTMLSSPVVRKLNSTTQTYYVCGNFSNVLYLAKFVTGTQTNLTSTALTFVTNTTKVEINGSSLKGYVDTVEKLSITDTSITSNLYCGIYQYGGNAASTIDDFAGADLGAGPGGVTYTQLESMQRGMYRGLRGTWGGSK